MIVLGSPGGIKHPTSTRMLTTIVQVRGSVFVLLWGVWGGVVAVTVVLLWRLPAPLKVVVIERSTSSSELYGHTQ